MVTLEERIAAAEQKKQKLEEQTRQASAFVKTLKAKARTAEKNKDRKERTRRLIQIGADVESKFGTLVDREAFNAWLETQRSWVKGFRNE